MSEVAGGSGWPDVGAGEVEPAERAKIVFQAQVDAATADLAAERDRETESHKADLARQTAALAAATAQTQAEDDHFLATAAASRAADLANLQSFSEHLSTLAVGSVERTRSGADVVQKASATIVTLYTGILGFVFVASDNPLPTRGVLAPIFLGLAVVLSTAYLAYVNASDGTTSGPLPVAGVEPKVIERLNATVEAASALATRRSYLLRSSVIALGVGLVYIALPFVSLGSTPAPVTPAAAPSVQPWPTPTTGIPDVLNAIVFTAQVQEVAAARAEAGASASAQAPVDDTRVLILLVLVGLGLTLLVPTVWKSS